MRNRIVLSCLVALLIPALVYVYLRAQPDTIYLQNANYQLMYDMYELYSTQSAIIVMLGDSHTFHVNWSELLGRKDIINRGIRGDIIPGFSQRLGQVIKLQPCYCFVMGGINDLYANYSVHQIISNYKKLLEELREHHINPIIQSTLYVAASYQHAAEVNSKVEEINTALREYAAEEHLPFLDINALLSTKTALRPEFTYDGLHLNAKGYALWKGVVEKALTQVGL